MASPVSTSAAAGPGTASSAFDARASEVPIPALLVERAIALGRAEVGLALVHTRRIAVRAVSALLGTIVACAFAQLTLVLLIAWPVLVARIPLVNLLAGVLMSALLSLAGGLFAALTWSHVARERRASPRRASSAERVSGYEMKEQPGAVNLTERVS
jgi:hypothetical protein